MMAKEVIVSFIFEQITMTGLIPCNRETTGSVKTFAKFGNAKRYMFMDSDPESK